LQNTYYKRVGEYIVRPAKSEDLPRAVSINLNTLPEHYSDSFFEELLTESPETFYVAELRGNIIGYIMCRIEYGFSNLKKFGFARKGHIVSVAVLDEHRGKGLGKSLVLEAINGMVQRGCGEAYLEVRVSNISAIALYQNLNFKIASKVSGYYRDGEAAYLMALSLVPNAS
jgi:ribosomal-protein-alanine N-acetyltransferase